jgi:hypothetical protein
LARALRSGSEFVAADDRAGAFGDGYIDGGEGFRRNKVAGMTVGVEQLSKTIEKFLVGTAGVAEKDSRSFSGSSRAEAKSSFSRFESGGVIMSHSSMRRMQEPGAKKYGKPAKRPNGKETARPERWRWLAITNGCA